MMMTQSLTLQLPEDMYRRLQQVAQTTPIKKLPAALPNLQAIFDLGGRVIVAAGVMPTNWQTTARPT